MTELLYASCPLSCLIVVSLPFVYTWFYSSMPVLRISAYSLLTDRLLSMTHSVLLYTSRSPYKL